ncbi:MAG TPA: 3-hydroxyacyl-CoA dehydrogenase family protein [Gemmatimonadales bacterium]|nr:3-hydroxyacyl-CoA dehydrogenase family protein [Gemmatimonadales bacterium]
MTTQSADIRTVAVLGCGLMGAGIAQVSAAAGYSTIVHDVNQTQVARGRAAIEKSLAKLVEKGKLTPSDRDAALARLSFATDLAATAGSDLVIEAVTEDLALKNRLWAELDGLCPPGTIFASNTSSIPIGSMAAATRRPDRFVGLHFFNPVALMPLVEVVRPAAASRETFERSLAFARSLGKETVVAKDAPGFIVNLLLVPYLLDAVRALENGVGTVVDIDTAMRLGCGYPMGPFTLLDVVGIDTVVRISEIMLAEYHDPRYSAPALIRRMAAAGRYGRKSGKGFYDYSVDPPAPSPA